MAALIDGARAAGLRWLVGEVLTGNARILAFMRRCGFAVTTRGGLEPGLVRVDRSVGWPLPAVQAAESWTGVARRRFHRLPSPRDAGPVFQTF